MKIVRLLLIVVIATFTSFAQGNIDATFGTNGTTKINTPLTFNATGGGIQTNGSQKDKIVIGGYDNNKFQIYRLLKDGQPDTSFGTGGIAASSPYGLAIYQIHGKGIAIDRNDNIFAAGTSSGGKCVITKFSPNGTSPQNLTLPISSGSNCIFMNLTAKESHIYVTGIQNISSTSTKIFIYRVDANSFTIDNTWNNNGLVETTVAAQIAPGMRISLAIEFPTRVYATVECYKNNFPSTLVLGFNHNGSLLGNGFGTIKPDFTPGNGAYSISKFAARDSLIQGRVLYTGGLKLPSTNDFSLVKIPITLTRDLAYKSAYLNSSAMTEFLTLNNQGKIIAVGRASGWNGNPDAVGIAKYEPNTDDLTNTWIPNNLQLIQRTPSPPVMNLPTYQKDRRVIIFSPFESLRGVLIQSTATNRILILSMKGMSSPYAAVTAMKDN